MRIQALFSILKPSLLRKYVDFRKSYIQRFLISNDHYFRLTSLNFNGYCIKVENMLSHSNQYILKHHDLGMSKRSSKNLSQNMQIFVMFSCCYHSEFQFQ